MAVTGTDSVALRHARTVVDRVFSVVRTNSMYERPIPERNRLIFYLGHLEAFDRNLVREAAHLSDIDPALDRLFAFGIDPEPGCLPSDQPSDWPELPEVEEYRDRVRAEIEECWMSLPEQLRHVALEHRLMHAETLAYLIHNLRPDQLEAPREAESIPSSGSTPRTEWCPVPAGEATLGRDCAHGFGWDNEFPRITVPVDAFRIARRKVSNGDYLRFVEQGGPVPHYWFERGGNWWLQRTFDSVPLPLDWPVWVTHSQATAYAEWSGGRLPTEAEWHRAAEDAEFLTGNFNARRWDPEPVDANPASASRWGVEDLCGNGWEWTSTLFRPFPGFRPFAFYPGYSANFFDDDHYVMKGASPRTDGVFTRRSFRNWFRKDYPYVFAAFRCINNP
jgi:formylglycine-generating enzyme required for sulfatase activity